MKKFLSLFAMSAMIAAGTMACHSRAANLNKVTRNVSVTSFSGVNVSNGIEVDIYPSSEYSLTVTTDEAVQPKVKVTQRGEMINISMDNSDRGFFKRYRNVKVKVKMTAPVVNTVIASGAAEVEIKGRMNLGNRNMDIDASGASQVEINSLACRAAKIVATGASQVEIDNLDASAGGVSVKASGASQVELEGTAGSVDLGASGASKIDASGLTAHEGAANASGSSTIKCHVAGKFKQTSSGASTVRNSPD